LPRALRRPRAQSNFVEFRNHKVVYRRYAGLFFCVCVDANDNELAYLEAIHLFVEVLGECDETGAAFGSEQGGTSAACAGTLMEL